MQLLIAGTFVGVLIIVLGLHWLLILRVEHRSGTALRKRLKRTFGGAARRLEVARTERPPSTVGLLNKVLVRSSSIRKPLEDLLQQADSNMSIGLFLLMSGTLCLAGYSIVTFLTGYRGIGVLAGAVLVFSPYIFLRWKRSRRLLQFEEKFPEAIDLIARALRAGHAFTTGIGMVAEEIPAPVGPEFKLLYDRQNYGMPLPAALRSFGERVPLLDARFFATAVLTQREAGGNLSEVLENLARVVRERFKVKRQIRVISAHARMTGFTLVGLPPATALAMFAVAPQNAKELVTDPLGLNMVIGAIVLQITGGLIIRKLVNIEY